MSSKNIEWTEDEKRIIIDLYPKMGILYCSNVLGRSKRGCQEMVKKLKIKKESRIKNEDDLRKIINESETYKECVIKFGLSPRCSGNFQTLKKYIKIYNIDISHFTGGKFKNISFNKVDLNEVLIKDSFYSRHSLKKRLYDDGLKKKECEICGIGEDWFNGSKIVHILDHINGEPYDNRIENLRIVCPNCNSTLETNCRGTKVNKIYDVENNTYKSSKTYKKCGCGKLILKESKMCSKCNGKYNRKSERPEYEILLKEIEELGYEGTGRKYGISGNGVKKWKINYENTG